MAAVQLDLRSLPPATAPLPGDLTEVPAADSVVVRGPVPALAGVLASLHKAERAAAVPVAWEPADDDDSRNLARALRIGSGLERVDLGIPGQRSHAVADYRQFRHQFRQEFYRDHRQPSPAREDQWDDKVVCG